MAVLLSSSIQRTRVTMTSVKGSTVPNQHRRSILILFVAFLLIVLGSYWLAVLTGPQPMDIVVNEMEAILLTGAALCAPTVMNCRAASKQGRRHTRGTGVMAASFPKRAVSDP